MTNRDKYTGVKSSECIYYKTDKTSTCRFFWKNGQTDFKDAVKLCNLVQDSSGAISWEPPDTPENIIKCNFQRFMLTARDVPSTPPYNNRQ